MAAIIDELGEESAVLLRFRRWAGLAHAAQIDYAGRAGAFLLRYAATIIAASAFAGSTEPLNVAPSSSEPRCSDVAFHGRGLLHAHDVARDQSASRSALDRDARAVTAPSMRAPASTVTS